MIDRDVLNSRMKDFFDCYQLLTKRDLSDDTLYDAIKATFDNRGLTYNPELQLFTESFATDAARIVRWKAFLKKIQWKETLDFKTVMEVIKERLQPMAERYWGKQCVVESSRKQETQKNHNHHFSEWLEGSDPDYHTAQDLYYKLAKRDGYMRSI